MVTVPLAPQDRLKEKPGVLPGRVTLPVSAADFRSLAIVSAPGGKSTTPNTEEKSEAHKSNL